MLSFVSRTIFVFMISGFFFVSPLLADDKITLALEGADIKQLVQWMSQYTDKGIVVHKDVKGKVTVLAGEPMSQAEAYQVFLSVLQVHGFIVVEADKVLKVIPDSRSKFANIPFVDGKTNVSKEALVVRIVKIENLAVADVVTFIKPLIDTKIAHLSPLVEANALLIADRSGNVERLIEIIDEIDQAGVIDIETIPIEFANAEELVKHVTKMMPNSKSSDKKNQLVITSDGRSNTILLSGNPITRKQVKELIRRLDIQQEGDGDTQVVFINYMPASELAAILKGVSGSVKKGETDQKTVKSDVNIEVSERNNALIITAPLIMQKKMKNIIKQLDQRRAQVLVEAVIVEVSDEVADNLGIQWQSSVSGKTIGGVSALPGTVSDSSFPSSLNGESASELILGGGLNLGFYRHDSLRAFVRALEVNAKANVLSKPTIVALDNEEAEILVGENVPFITGAATGANNENPFQTIKRQDIGVSLKVKPRVNNDGSLTLEITQSVESIGNAAVKTADIVTKKRTIKTRVLIDDDAVLVLGGLMRDEVTESETKVPILGSIPLLGRLFKSNSTRTVKKNLMVFIHPKILHSSQDNRSVTHTRYNQIIEEQSTLNTALNGLYKDAVLPRLTELPWQEED